MFQSKQKGHWKKNCPLLQDSEKKKSADTVNMITLSGEDFENILVVTTMFSSSS